jgi:hypothetical protein
VSATAARPRDADSGPQRAAFRDVIRGLNEVDLAVRTLAGRVEGQNAIHVMVVPKL